MFPFIKTLGGAGGSFAAQMENAEFKINNGRRCAKPSTSLARSYTSPSPAERARAATVSSYPTRSMKLRGERRAIHQIPLAAI